jgi:opacity protein-like surface antigen
MCTPAGGIWAAGCVADAAGGDHRHFDRRHDLLHQGEGPDLRGDIGFSNQRVDRLNNALDAGLTTQSQSLNFNTAGIFGLGVGYKFNNWFRADVTGEYRGNSQFFGKDNITYVGGVGTDTYHATKSEWVVLANAYVDLGTWWCITRSSAPASAARGLRSTASRPEHCQQWRRCAAGLAYGAASRSGTSPGGACRSRLQGHADFTVELAYRYLDMGDGLTGDLRTFDGINAINNPMTFKNITSHDLKLGVRWDLTSPQVYAPPLIRKG